MAQRLTGTVRSGDGPLGFVAIRPLAGRQSTATNVEGRYELALPPGQHRVLFQSLGYKSTERTVQMGADNQVLDILLEPQPILLAEAVVGNTEDPARSIMRRAIAKAPVERLKVLGYTAQVYLKGGAKLTNIPWLLEGRLKKEGITENTVFFSETLSELTYRAPNFYKNRALSIRSNMDKLGGGTSSPNRFVNASFYAPKVAQAVSPLAPNAFAYYRFTYEGIFTDNGAEVNKIRVRPRQRGDDVFDGYIYILEGEWCIHSLSLTTEHEGIKTVVNQLYTPVQGVWMPATQKYNISGKVLGFTFEASYLASLKDYKLSVNQALIKPLEVVDERQDPETTKTLRKQEASKTQEDLKRALTDSTTNKRMTRKALRRAMRAAMQEQKKQTADKYEGKTIVQEDSLIIDSLAYKKDSTFWAATRAVPLTLLEVASTVRLDSVADVKKEKELKDSVKNAIKRGEANTGNVTGDIFNTLSYGRVWYLTKKDTSKAGRLLVRPHRLRFIGVVNENLSYNTVEGYGIEAKLRYQYYRPATKTQSYKEFYIGPKVRYQTARNHALPVLEAEYRHSKGSIRLQGGQYISQINAATGISPIINGMASLFFERNYMRLYQKDFARLETENYYEDRLQVNTYAEWASRNTQENNVRRPLINWTDRTFAPNNGDANAFAGTLGVGNHKAATAGFALIYTPTVKYILRNGQRSFTTGSEPYLHLKTNVGLPGVAGSTTRFGNTAVGVEQSLSIGVRGRLSYYAEAGAFWWQQKTYAPDYFHFEGNRTFLIVGDGLRAFRNLPYYYYSTPSRYAQLHAIYTPRQFLFSRLTLVRMLGWRESFGYHGLVTPHGGIYSEATYGLDGIFRIARIEAVASFRGGRYEQTSVRIGLTLKTLTPKLKRGRGPGNNDNNNDGAININL